MNMTFVPDALVVLLSLWHPAFVLVALIQYVVRRHPFTARGFWLLLGCPETTELLLVLLPGLDIMSNDQAVPPGAGVVPAPVPTTTAPVPTPQQHHSEPLSEGLIATAADLIARHNLSAQQAAELLAVLRKPDGEPLLSANKIREIVGGNEATVKSWVRNKRTLQFTPQSIGQQGRWEFDDHGNMQKVR